MPKTTKRFHKRSEWFKIDFENRHFLTTCLKVSASQIKICFCLELIFEQKCTPSWPLSSKLHNWGYTKILIFRKLGIRKFRRAYLGAVHKLCRLKSRNFWPPPPPFFVVFLISKIGDFWPPYRDDIVYGRSSYVILKKATVRYSKQPKSAL